MKPIASSTKFLAALAVALAAGTLGISQAGAANPAESDVNSSTTTPPIGFAPAVRYPIAGTNLQDIVSADFNGDRVADLAMADMATGSVTILLGKGDGTFTPGGSYSVGGSASGVNAITAADFNGDGKVDLATSNAFQSASVIAVVLGIGDGTFAAPTSYAVTPEPHSVATGDLNGDGHVDLIAGTSGDVSVLLGRGDGTFAPAVGYPAGTYPWSVVVADFNGDGKADIAAANYFSADVSILLGHGDGTFASPAAARATYGVAGSPWSIASADFNGDGKVDLATANTNNGFDVSVLLGRGDGTFRRASSFATPDGPGRAIDINDFNGDGKPDLAIAHQEGGKVSFLPGQGDGTFGQAVTFDTFDTGDNTYSLAYTYSVTSADFNGDGRPDLATATSVSAISGVSVLLNNGQPDPCEGMPAPPPAPGKFPGAWMPKGDLNAYHYDATSTVLKDGRILLVGGVLGDGSGGPYATAEVYDPVTGKWTQTGTMVLEGGPYWHTATRLSDGKVLVAGGYITDTAEIYDPATNSWTATGNMVISRYRHSAALLPNGKVLVAGGYNGASEPINSAELYDPVTGTWAPTGAMNSNHTNAVDTAVLLKTGKVLIEGGFFADVTAELYDPATGTWARTGDLHIGRSFHRATLLPDGRVLVSAGFGGGNSRYAELYDPDTGIWCLTGSMHVGRTYTTATLLPGGEVLIAGGNGGGGGFRGETREAEVWNPVTGAWKLTARMKLARRNHIAAPLPNGDVLVASGGVGPFYNAAKTSEIFHPRSANSKSQPAPTKSAGKPSRRAYSAMADGSVTNPPLLMGGGRYIGVESEQAATWGMPLPSGSGPASGARDAIPPWRLE